MEPRYRSSAFPVEAIYTAPSPAPWSESPCRTPFGRAPRGAGGGAPFGALPNMPGSISHVRLDYHSLTNNIFLLNKSALVVIAVFTLGIIQHQPAKHAYYLWHC
jgi:hypothetical protein